tara:strand:+ start:904 stop:2436 length:1533 start_codon:yes stop_codon:yes gene_type:complete
MKNKNEDGVHNEFRSQEENKIVTERKEKLKEIQEAYGISYPNQHKPTGRAKRIIDKYSSLERNELETQKVRISLAGRIILRRNQGKTTFCVLKDSTEKIQLYLNKEVLGEEKYAYQKLIDLGDVVFCSGTIFKTMRGELTVNCDEVKILAKALQPFPEKFHGLQDPDLRYRNRHIDLAVNTEVKNIFLKRSSIINKIREYMNSDGFLEVETPMLHPIPGGATAKPFITKHNSLDQKMYLRVAPELYLKRLIIGGFEKVYELNRSFRNEGISVRHNPEFTMLEFYAAYQDYNWCMNFTESLLKDVCKNIVGEKELVWDDHRVDISKPFERLSFENAIYKYFPNLKDANLRSKKEMTDILKRYELTETIDLDSSSSEMLMVHLFESLVEEKIVQPTFIMDHPTEISPLARSSEKNPSVSERFELYIGGKEIANGFSELNDPQEQARRMRAQAMKKDAGDDEAMYFDEEYIRALEFAMPPAAGCGIGIDRLTMFLTNSHSIREVILFPALKRK